jgi:hypothetical protein
MHLIEIAQRPDRHNDLLNAAEAFKPSALICFERGGPDNFRRANELALAILPSPGGDIGWQIVDVGLMLTRHAAHLTPTAKAHLEGLLLQSIDAWKERDFGRGNVNHPVIATWVYAAAGRALQRPDFDSIAGERLRRFVHIFSQAGDMSEYNSPTYLGPALIGLAAIGTHASLESTRLRARLIEERIWLSAIARWHPPTQQLAGPHSRAYADSTLGFGGIFRYLAHAVLETPVFWDDALSFAYDHHYEAEWAGKVAASVFCFPDYLQTIAEEKPFPWTVCSTTDGEDYTVDGKEIYRGGWGRLSTYLTPLYCLGSAERPYVDGGQTESCIAYWRRAQPLRGFSDLRSLYLRYVANGRLPGQSNTYFAWYGGRDTTYSPNLLHQDGRLHVLQHDGKAMILAQPLRRENGRIHSLRFDALFPLYAPFDEIWLGDQELKGLPAQSAWFIPILLRDQDVYLALRPLEPVDLGSGQPAVEVFEANHHLIVSIYNLRGTQPRFFPPYILDQAHNGLVLEIGSAAEYGNFDAFRRHIAGCELSEEQAVGEIRRVRYLSGPDEIEMSYNPLTQEVLSSEVNRQMVQYGGFSCPYAVQGSGGSLHLQGVSLQTGAGVPAWLAYEPASGWVTAVVPTDQPVPLRLATPAGMVACGSISGGRIRVHCQDTVSIEVDALNLGAPLHLNGVQKIGRVLLNGRETPALPDQGTQDWVVA